MTGLTAIRDGIEASGLVRPSFLRHYNVAGFYIVAKRGYFGSVARRFPWLDPFLDLVDPMTNALYMNPVVAVAGSEMKKHRDNTLVHYDRTIAHCHRVTIQYIEITDLAGGRLVLYEGDRRRTIDPAAGLLIRFDGSLYHEMETVESGRRVSFVMEEYRLPPWQLRWVPNCIIH